MCASHRAAGSSSRLSSVGPSGTRQPAAAVGRRIRRIYNARMLMEMLRIIGSPQGTGSPANSYYFGTVVYYC